MPGLSQSEESPVLPDQPVSVSAAPGLLNVLDFRKRPPPPPRSALLPPPLFRCTEEASEADADMHFRHGASHWLLKSLLRLMDGEPGYCCPKGRNLILPILPELSSRAASSSAVLRYAILDARRANVRPDVL